MCAKGTGRTDDLAGTTRVNAAEVAASFGVRMSTIHTWYRERKMPVYKMAGGRLILPEHALAARIRGRIVHGSFDLRRLSMTPAIALPRGCGADRTGI